MLGVFVLVAPTAGALTSAESIAKLNQQRAANGIPAGIVERPDWSDACRKHDGYTKAHGLTHDEDSSQPDYTPEGRGPARTRCCPLRMVGGSPPSKARGSTRRFT